MPAKRYKVTLTTEERAALLKLINKGKGAARELGHARILLKADESETGASLRDEEISEHLQVSVSTIERVRKRFVEEGLERALRHKRPYRTRFKKLDGEVEAQLVALACAEPPTGRERWTMQLLADKLVELEMVENISDETVRLALKKMNLNPG